MAASLGSALFARRSFADEGELHNPTSAPNVLPDLGPGRKFSASGKAQRFPGNTFVCHLNQPGRQFEAMQQVYAELRTRVGEEQMLWLPPSSYHMTVFDGVLDANRRPGDWPHDLPLDASMRVCDDYIAGRLADFDLGFDPPIRMVAYEEPLTPAWTAIPLRPVDEVEAKRLRSLRERLSQLSGIRHAGHDGYTFHSTFGYRIQPLTDSTTPRYMDALRTAVRAMRSRIPEFEMDAPAFCVFDDMLAFHTRLLLARKSTRAHG